MAKFKVGDRVVCIRGKSNGRTGTVAELSRCPWVNFDDYRPEIHNGTGCGLGIPQGHADCLTEDELEPIATPDDDEIRVGDTVERGPNWGWRNQGGGTNGVVTEELRNGWVMVRWANGEENSYRWSKDGHKDIQKVRAGGPVSTNKTTSHEQVLGKPEGERNRQGEGHPIGARRPAGRTVPPVADLGNPTRGKERRARIAAPQIQPPAGCKSDR